MTGRSDVPPPLWFLIATVAAVFAWSAISPHDYFTWFLEVVPALIGFTVLAATYRNFHFTLFLYALIAVQMMILFVGGHYTYAHVPLFDWTRDHFHQQRNNYDRVGHFAQGFVPALIARELFVRLNVIGRDRRRWTGFIVIAICLGISAAYELFEWLVAISTGAKAEEFLGTQGDPWDTQEDMATALVAATIAMIFFSRMHDRFIRRVESKEA